MEEEEEDAWLFFVFLVLSSALDPGEEGAPFVQAPPTPSPPLLLLQAFLQRLKYP